MAAHRYWRLTINTVSAGATYLLGSLELRTVSGGTNHSLTGSGTASASNTSYNAASAAFDNDPNTYWGQASPGEWVKWDFGAGNDKDITSVTLRNGSAGSVARPLTGTIAYSDDNSAWTDLMMVNGSANVSTATETIYVEPAHITCAISLPKIESSGSGAYFAQVTLPMLGVQSNSGAGMALALPMLSVYAAGHDAFGDRNADITLPMLAFQGLGGANATAELPMLTVSMSGTNAIAARATVSLPALSVAATATVAGTSAVAATLPMFSMIGYSGAVLSVSLDNGVQLTATGKGGGVCSAAITLPLLEVTAGAAAQNHGGLSKSLPALRMVPSGKALILLPGLKLTAIGTATVAVTYEAYALNLKHAPRRGEDPIDEMTHFVNYPFDYIVRHQNSYFGVNSTGLYLLEGTTDDSTPITWAFETAKTDFKSEQLKTVESAYFGGSMGPNATVTIKASASVDDEVSYSYTTPRGTSEQNYRQPFGRGLKARYFAFGAESAGVLSLDSITFNKATLARKV